MAYFNSKLSTYFLFMTISSYGIEREQIMKNEYLSIPINIDNLKFEELLKCINKIINNHKKSSLFDDLQIQETFDSRIESIINSSLKLTKREILLIDDLVNYNLELFHNNESAKAMMPVQNMWDYSKVLSTELDEFIAEQSLYANIMIYSIDTTSPLSLVKISFSKKHKGIIESKEKLSKELNDLDKYLWASHATNIYFRKKLNYFDGNDIYIIRPNQRRFWSQSMAMEDASEIISEILNSK